MASFPSEFCDKKIKLSKSYGLEYAKAMVYGYSGTTGTWRNNYLRLYSEYRYLYDIASGQQSNDALLSSMGFNSTSVSGIDISTFKIDLNTLNLATIFVNYVRSKVASRKYGVSASVIDPLAINALKTKQALIQAFYKVKEAYSQEIAKTIFPDLEIDSEFDSEEEAVAEATTSMTQQITIDAEVMLSLLTNVINDFDQVMQEVIYDFIVVGKGGTYTYLDKNKVPRVKRIDPTGLVHSYQNSEKYDNLVYAGQIEFISQNQFISETCNELTEEEQNKIIDTYGQSDYYINNQSTVAINPYVSNSYSYKYIPVLRFQFLSNDEEVYEVKKTKYGNKKVYEKDFKYKPTKDYLNKYKSEREVIRAKYVNKYGGTYVIGSSVVYDYGIQEGLVDEFNNKKLDYNVYAPIEKFGKSTSLVAQMIEPLSMINVTHNKIKQILANGRMGMLELDLSQLEEMAWGAGGEKLTPKQLVELMMRNGIILKRSMLAIGSELVNTRDRGPVAREVDLALTLNDYIMVMERYIGMISRITGINTSLNSPLTNQTTGVTEIAVESADLSIGYLYHAAKKVSEMTHWSLLEQGQIASHYGRVFQGMVDALGEGTVKFFQTQKNMSLKRYGITLVPEPTPQDWANLYASLDYALKEGSISAADAINIRAITNYKQASISFAVRQKRYRKQQQRDAQAAQQANNQAQAQAAQQNAQMQAQQVQMEYENTMRLAQMNHQFKMEELRLQGEINMQVAAIKNDGVITAAEKSAFGKLLATTQAGRATIAKSEIVHAHEENIHHLKNEHELGMAMVNNALEQNTDGKQAD